MEQLASLLAALGREPDELISIESFSRGYREFLTVEQVSTHTELGDGDWYFSVNPLRERPKKGRGKSQDFPKLTTLWIDLDAGKVDCQALLDRMTDVVGVPPVAVVHTGSGGMHPYWRLTEPITPSLLRAWGQLVKVEAKKLGGKADSVFDPARVLRLPGVTRPNGTKATLARVGTELVKSADLFELVKEFELTTRNAVAENAVAFDTWEPAERTCPYVRTMIEAWPDEELIERHTWLLNKVHRLMAALRLGCITAEDFERGKNVAIERFSEAVLTTPNKKRDANEIISIIEDAKDKTQYKTEAYLREQELGGHTCMSAQGELKEAGSWERKNLRDAYLNPDARPKPELWEREDGIFLLYPGKTHSIHGESESGKSMLMQWEVAQQLKADKSVLYLDYEDSDYGVIDRLRLMGVTLDQLDQLYYINPEQDYGRTTQDRADWEALLELSFSLCIIDGVTAAMLQAPSLVEKTGGGNDAAASWLKRMPDVIAKKTGAAVVIIDHVSKGNGGRMAIGGQSKMSGLSGSAYVVTPVEALGRGLIGRLKIEVGKDRPGYVRGYAVGKLGENRLQQIATIEVDGTDDQLSVRTMVPQEEPDKRQLNAEIDNGSRLRKISAYLQELPDGASANTIRQAIGVGRDATNTACKQLEEGGYIEKVGSGPKTRYVHAKPFNANARGALSFLIED